jgi:PAS domain S-box-containing protein
MTEIRASNHAQLGDGEHTTPVEALINGEQIKILHVDDDTQFLYLLKELLETVNKSFLMHSTSSAKEALELLRGQHFDFIISDYMMPGMNGIEFTQRVRRDSNTPLIIYTGHGSSKLAERAFEAGVDDFMDKSLDSAGVRTLSKRILTMVGNHRAGVALRESEARFKSIVENSLNGVLIARFAEPHLVFVNQKLADMLGYNVDEIMGFTEQQVIGLVHKDDREKIYSSFEERFKGRDEPTRIKCRIKRKDEAMILLEVSPSIVEYKEESAVQATFLDVTERETEGRALKDSEEMYKSLVELAPDGIITLDLKGFVTSANSAYYRLTGFNEDEIIGKHFTKIGAARIRDLPKYIEIFASLLRGGHPPSFEFEFLRKDGSKRWGESHFALINIKGKRQIIAIARDITNRRNADEKLKVVGKLARHDMRNKIAIIGGYVSLLKMRQNEEQTLEESITEIDNAVDQIGMIMDFAADYERLGSEEKKAIDVAASFNSACSMFDLEEVLVENQCTGLAVSADSLLSRIFYNFIDNSLRHGGNVGKIRLSSEKGKTLKIVYEDDGIGIPRNRKKKLFESNMEEEGTAWGYLGTGRGSCSRATWKRKGSTV